MKTSQKLIYLCMCITYFAIASISIQSNIIGILSINIFQNFFISKSTISRPLNFGSQSNNIFAFL